LKLQIYNDDKAEKMTEAMRQKIEKIKAESFFSMEKELNNKFDKKLKMKGKEKAKIETIAN